VDLKIIVIILCEFCCPKEIEKPTFVLFNKENLYEFQGFNKVVSCDEHSPTSRGKKRYHFLEN